MFLRVFTNIPYPQFNVKKFLFDAREVAKEIVREADKADDVDLPNKQDVLTV